MNSTRFHCEDGHILRRYLYIWSSRGTRQSFHHSRILSFICEYAGEVIDVAKVNKNRGYDDEYVFDTSRIYDPFKWNYEPSLLEEISSNVSCEDYDIPSPLIISSKKFGNVARYMNHSCSPNVFWQPVLYAENNQSFLHIALCILSLGIYIFQEGAMWLLSFLS